MEWGMGGGAPSGALLRAVRSSCCADFFRSCADDAYDTMCVVGMCISAHASLSIPILELVLSTAKCPMCRKWICAQPWSSCKVVVNGVSADAIAVRKAVVQDGARSA